MVLASAQPCKVGRSFQLETEGSFSLSGGTAIANIVISRLPLANHCLLGQFDVSVRRVVIGHVERDGGAAQGCRILFEEAPIITTH